MNKSSFSLLATLLSRLSKNPKILKFLTEESKKYTQKKPKQNLINDVKVYFKSKKELDKYTPRELVTSRICC